MKAFQRALLVCIALALSLETATSAEQDLKLVTRIETAKAKIKRGRVVIQVTAKATTPGLRVSGGRLLRHNEDNRPNKEGLVEYDFLYRAPRNYSGFKLRGVTASRKDSPIPPEVKGVRILAEFNHYDVLFPAPKEKKK